MSKNNRIRKYITMTEKENKAFFETVDWASLCLFVKTLYGVSPESFTCRQNKAFAEMFECKWEENIASMCGILRTGFESAHLQSFEARIQQEIEYDKNLLEKALKENRYGIGYKELDAIYYPPTLFLSVDVAYQLMGSGRNGVTLFRARWTTAAGWQLRCTDGREFVCRDGVLKEVDKSVD